MPVVLTTAEGKEQAGYTYDDRTGESYEYPNGRYESDIWAGQRFLYHQGKRGYTGAGVIGAIHASPVAGRLICQILDYLAFPTPVPLKNSANEYFEADPQVWKTGNVYWAQGVRRIADDRFDAVLDCAEVAASAAAAARKPLATPSSSKGGLKYATAEEAAAVDAYAMSVAMLMVAASYPGEPIEQMPHNNPGFDIRVGPPHQVVQYVEVKGTRSGEPVFFLSEGERLFSERNAHRYSLLVVSGINLKAKSHVTIETRRGAVAAPTAELVPTQWRGRLT